MQKSCVVNAVDDVLVPPKMCAATAGERWPTNEDNRVKVKSFCL